MARRARAYVAGYTYHVVQRGVNRAQTFFGSADYEFYLSLWHNYSLECELEVHSYCLMPNHIHFLVTPRKNEAISTTTRRVGSHYAAYINRKYRRTGTLWEGRHKSSLIDTDSYLLRCYRYIELNPVRAGIVLKPASYRWSSYRMNRSATPAWVSPHPRFLEFTRSADYESFVMEPLLEWETRHISAAMNSNLPVGSDSFIKQFERQHRVQFPRHRSTQPG